MKNNQTAAEKIIVAVDFPNRKDAENLFKQLKGQAVYYKIGLEMFVHDGWEMVNQVRACGARVFLDLKLHDIPNTVAGAVAAACAHDIDIVNVHALGGFEMMECAAEAVKKSGKKTKLIAVTILTSHDQNTLDQDLKIKNTISDQVVHLAQLAKKAGLDGVVASPQEVALIRKAVPGDFLIVTPGVRPAGADLNDQKRVYTPARAVQEGADYLVIGRPITQAKDSSAAFQAILEEIKSAR